MASEAERIIDRELVEILEEIQRLLDEVRRRVAGNGN